MTLSTISTVELINKREFAKVALDMNLETFVVHISAPAIPENSIHLSQATQIAAMQWDKIFIKVWVTYPDYADVFSMDLTL